MLYISFDNFYNDFTRHPSVTTPPTAMPCSPHPVFHLTHTSSACAWRRIREGIQAIFLPHVNDHKQQEMSVVSCPHHGQCLLYTWAQRPNFEYFWEADDDIGNTGGLSCWGKGTSSGSPLYHVETTLGIIFAGPQVLFDCSTAWKSSLEA